VTRDGLTAAEVEDRVRRGLVNEVPPAPSRTVTEILRANVLTRFNALIGLLVVIVLASGSPQDALFGGVIIANSVIGIIQEVRAKRSARSAGVLSRRARTSSATARSSRCSVDDIVLDDVIELRPGGRSWPMPRCSSPTPRDRRIAPHRRGRRRGEGRGSEVLSGSFVVTGSGRAQVTKVGADAYAAKLAEEARRFTLANSRAAQPRSTRSSPGCRGR
jgi:cation-transporting ATPase E